MKPGDHPEFFRFPAPEGRSRESTLRLDREGRFWHDGRLVEHPGLRAGLHSWISRHPDDGRYVVQALKVAPDQVTLVLDDATEEVWDPATTQVGEGAALYAAVKRTA